MMFDQTPAWSEVYARIADELVSRFPTFWGAIDWLTLIGNDPNRENYPPEWQVWMPAHLRGTMTHLVGLETVPNLGATARPDSCRWQFVF